MAVRLRVWIGAGVPIAWIKKDDSLGVGPGRKWVWQRVAELYQAGLQGVELGNYLIKRVVRELQVGKGEL